MDRVSYQQYHRQEANEMRGWDKMREASPLEWLEYMYFVLARGEKKGVPQQYNHYHFTEGTPKRSANGPRLPGCSHPSADISAAQKSTNNWNTYPPSPPYLFPD